MLVTTQKFQERQYCIRNVRSILTLLSCYGIVLNKKVIHAAVLMTLCKC